MRLLVILSPTGKWGTKIEYTKLRKSLTKDGYLRIAPEVYICTTFAVDRKTVSKYLYGYRRSGLSGKNGGC